MSEVWVFLAEGIDILFAELVNLFKQVVDLLKVFVHLRVVFDDFLDHFPVDFVERSEVIVEHVLLE